jgi:hypothetical protein
MQRAPCVARIRRANSDPLELSTIACATEQSPDLSLDRDTRIVGPMRDISDRAASAHKRAGPSTISGDALSDPSWSRVVCWLAEDPAVLAYLDIPDRAATFMIDRRTIDVDKALDRLRRSIA